MIFCARIKCASHTTGLILAVFLLAVAACALPAGAITLTPGSSSTAVIAQGDPVSVTGIATGHPSPGLQIWFIGYNYAKVTTVQVNNDNSFDYELKKSDTANLAPGQYVVIVQHPMMNGRFDVVYDSSTGNVNNVLTGKTLYRLSGSGRLQSTNSASALMQAIGNQNIDDTFSAVSFYVGKPNAMINPIGDKYVGETFTINGSTNLAVGDELNVQIYSSSFGPTQKSESSGFSGVSGMVKVVPGTSSANSWSFDVDTSTFTPDEYIVTVSAVLQDVTATQTFNVLSDSSICAATGDTCSVGPVNASEGISNLSVSVANNTVTSGTGTATAVTSVESSSAQPVETTATTKSPLPGILVIPGFVAAVLLARKW
ncbi:MAG: hypothetical protein WC342_07450 [Methanoregula sp.]